MNETILTAHLSLQDIYLKRFQENNPHCKFTMEASNFVLQNPWGSESCRLSYNLEDSDAIKELNHLAFRPPFDAIIHVDTNEIEFIYGYLLPDEEPTKAHCDRIFNLHFDGVDFTCRFDNPSDRLLEIAGRVRWLPAEPSEEVVSQLRVFKEAQRTDKLPESAAAYFAERVPRSFFVKANRPVLEVKIEDVARHMNFVMHYYDRRTPFIEIRQDATKGQCKQVHPRRFCEGVYPSSLALNRIDDFILQLLEVARRTSPRFAFIYYYQVIEYAGFYFVDEKVRKSLKRFLRDPSMITCPDEKVQELFVTLSDLAHSDEIRMRKVIEECCDPSALWLEIENDREFFCNELLFDGGFILPALISANTTKEAWAAMWTPKLFDQITKVRNCLVHARERRQSNVILPTTSNNCRIERYLPLITRLAEQIALKNN